MPSIVHEFSWPDRVVVGTIGQPGSRTFYLQVRAGAQIVSVGLEKQQSAVLADTIDGLLDQLMANEGNPFSIPTSTPIELVDNDPLDQPVEEEFRTGAMSLGWDPSTVQVVLEAHRYVDQDEDDELEFDSSQSEEVLLVRMPVGTARAFAKRTREVVGAGRPLCPFCGEPVDPQGHICSFPGDL